MAEKAQQADQVVRILRLAAHLERQGRSAEYRLRLGEALTNACREMLGLDPLRLKVEFNQHAGDEIYGTLEIDGSLQGGLGRDWTPEETHAPLMETLRTERSGKG